jgi:hypothetical protein
MRYYVDSKTDRYRGISSTEFTLGVEVFEKLLKNQALDNMLKSQLNQLQLQYEKLSDARVILIDRLRQGRGFYLINYGNRKNMLSIPHRFFDKKTGTIAIKLMIEQPYRAAAFNTVSRKVIDQAHTRDTLFQAFHIAYANTYPQEYMYQLHGFGKTKNKNDTTNIIVSSTTVPATNRAKKIDSCLNIIGYNSKLYGESIFELGGTTNMQANLLRESGYWNFLHIELQYKVRELLNKDQLSRAKFSKCIE